MENLAAKIESCSQKLLQQPLPKGLIPGLTSRKSETTKPPRSGGTSSPHERIATYARPFRDNDLQDGEFGPIPIRKFEETLSEETKTQCYCSEPDLEESFTVLSRSMDAHADAIRETQKGFNAPKARRRRGKASREAIPRSPIEQDRDRSQSRVVGRHRPSPKT